MGWNIVSRSLICSHLHCTGFLYAKVTPLQHFLMIFSARTLFYACSAHYPPNHSISWTRAHYTLLLYSSPRDNPSDVSFLEPALSSRASITEPTSQHGISRVEEAERSQPRTTGINQRARTAVGYTVEGLLLYSLAEYSRNISLVHILKDVLHMKSETIRARITTMTNMATICSMLYISWSMLELSTYTHMILKILV